MTDSKSRTRVQVEPAKASPGAEAVSPLVDIYELEDGTVVLEAEMPGCPEESVNLRVDKGVLTISAEAALDEPAEEYSQTYRGFVCGEYFRAFALSDEVDRDRTEAKLIDGVLTVRLPRAAAAATRKIDIHVE